MLAGLSLQPIYALQNIDFCIHFNVASLAMLQILLLFAFIMSMAGSEPCSIDKAKYCLLGDDNTMCTFCGVDNIACYESLIHNNLTEVCIVLSFKKPIHSFCFVSDRKEHFGGQAQHPSF